jgi:hypothetical protein
MTTEVILFILRLVSAALLITLLVVLLIVMWREYNQAANHLVSRKRSYGHLTVLREIDGQYMATGEDYPLLPSTSLGRSATNTIPINDTFASSEHALVTLRDGQWWLEDRRSRNGTMLNDMPVMQPVVITHGDIIGVGHIKFRLELEQ